eukprot:3595692-Rhodomonas_salina.1
MPNLLCGSSSALARQRNLLDEEELTPLCPPGVDGGEVSVVAVDDGRTQCYPSISEVDGVRDPVRHGREPFLANVFVLHELRDDLT